MAQDVSMEQQQLMTAIHGLAAVISDLSDFHLLSPILN
jgi:hypothetical protein